MNTLSIWSLLVLTLPTENATARMRFWRALKAKGCAVLRDGIYLLPYTGEHEATLRGSRTRSPKAARPAARAQSRRVTGTGIPRAVRSRRRLRGLHANPHRRAQDTGRTVPTELTRLLRRLRKDFDAIRVIDYFPGDSATRAEVALQFRRAGRHRAVTGRAARGPRHSPAGDWRVPRSHVGDAAADVGRSRRECMVDPPIHRRARPLHLACGAGGLPGRRARLRFRRCDVHARRRARDLRGATRQFRAENDAALTRLGEIVHALDAAAPRA